MKAWYCTRFTIMFALVDCNSCYASCETIFRPDLRGKPVVVLSNNDGIIVARNRAAKAIGLPDLAAYFKVEHLIRQHKVQVFSSNYELYADISSRVMQTLEQFAPEIEIYSIDEAFLSLNGCLEDFTDLGQRIRRTLWREVRMPVSVGVAPTKTLAKLANHVGKNKADYRGVCVWQRAEQAYPLMRQLPVKKIWGVGRRIAAHLNAMNILTVHDLACQSPKQMRKRFNVMLERTVRELNGEPCIELDDEPANKQQIFTTRTFGKRITQIGELQEAVSNYVSRACEKLRAQQSLARQVLVFIQTSRFDELYYNNQRIIQLPYPSNDTRLISAIARHAVITLYRPDLPYYKAGVGLLDLSAAQQQQLHLFDAQQPEKDLQLMNTLDRINQRFPQGIAIAANGIKKEWTMRRPRRSPSYTTQWQDLPLIKC